MEAMEQRYTKSASRSVHIVMLMANLTFVNLDMRYLVSERAPFAIML